MELKPGYKQTEVGVIPEDWSVQPFDAVFKKAPAKNHQIQTKDYQDSGTHPVVDQGQTPIIGYSDREDRVYRVPDGGVVVFGDHTCIVKLVKHDFIVGADGTQILTARAMHDVQFHAYALMHRGVAATGYNRHFKFLKERNFQAPPPPEQRAIAETLEDVDALISALDRLIAKKHDLKQAAMQQLLTGQTRLPGFSGEWEVKRLGEISLMHGRIGWQGLTQTEFTSNAEDPFLITGTDFKDGDINWGTAYHVSYERYEVAPQIQLHSGDVLMTKDGTIGKMLYVKAIPYPGLATLNSHLLVLRPINNSYIPRFLFYQMLSRRFLNHIEQNKSGSTFFGLGQEATSRFMVLLPCLNEQQAIAAVLSDMDAEIAALEARCDKTRALKQGMMQELLTGRTRLV